MDSTDIKVRDHTLSAHVATEVRAYLARRRLSASKAAKAIGWKQQYLARRLSGDVAFDVDELGALAELLDCRVTDFFGGPSSGGVNVNYQRRPIPHKSAFTWDFCLIDASAIAQDWSLAA
jgi:transcriptional regulator with XRE-family HTH domain